VLPGQALKHWERSLRRGQSGEKAGPGAEAAQPCACWQLASRRVNRMHLLPEGKGGWLLQRSWMEATSGLQQSQAPP